MTSPTIVKTIEIIKTSRDSLALGLQGQHLDYTLRAVSLVTKCEQLVGMTEL